MDDDSKKLFQKLFNKLDNIEAQNKITNDRLDKIEAQNKTTNDRLDKIESRLDVMEVYDFHHKRELFFKIICISGSFVLKQCNLFICIFSFR